MNEQSPNPPYWVTGMTCDSLCGDILQVLKLLLLLMTSWGLSVETAESLIYCMQRLKTYWVHSSPLGTAKILIILHNRANREVGKYACKACSLLMYRIFTIMPQGILLFYLYWKVF